MFMSPLLLPPSAWLGHIPFAAWLVEMQRPELLVELGTHAGASFFSFCQSVVENNLPTKCFAVDTWQGDEHAGHYGEEMFSEVSNYHQSHYASFSRLLRMTFDEALAEFADHTVDLLHIDGLHTYEAVKHDFETWLPKMSERGVILFHDTQVRERGFGVWKFWTEVSCNYPHFEFHHAYGLGVLLVGKSIPSSLLDFAALCKDDSNGPLVRELFSRTGAALELGIKTESLEKEKTSLRADFSAQLLSQAAMVEALKVDCLERLAALESSTSWRITSPLRTVGALLKKNSKKSD